MMGERSPIWDSDARGTFIGLTLASGRGALVRAVLEGAAFAVRHNVEVAAAAGIAVDASCARSAAARAAGSGSQIKADVVGVPVLLPETSIGAPFGDAALAAVAAGLHAGRRRARRHRARPRALRAAASRSATTRSTASTGARTRRSATSSARWRRPDERCS